MKSFLDHQNEALDDAIRFAKAAREHPNRADVYIAAARKALKLAGVMNKRTK